MAAQAGPFENVEKRPVFYFLFFSRCITSHIDLGGSDNSIHHAPKPFQRATRVRQEAQANQIKE